MNEIENIIQNFARVNFGGKHLNISQEVWKKLAKTIEQHVEERLQDASYNLDKALKTIEVIIKNQSKIREQHQQYVINARIEELEKAYGLLNRTEYMTYRIAELKKGLDNGNT